MKHSFLVFVLALSSTMITQAGDQMQTSKKLNRSLEIELDYLLSLPENYESKDEWPLILFLH